jgi:HlyD family secretion protein
MRQTIPKITDPTANGKSDDGSLGSLGLADSTAADTFTDPAYRTRDGSSTGAHRRRWRIVLAVVVVTAVAIAIGYFLLQPSARALTATVLRGSIVSTVETTGKLEAETSAKLAFKASGRVAQVFAKQGDRVKTGEVLAELDTSALKRQLDGANMQLQISQLKVQQAKEGGSEDQVAAAQANLDGALANLNSLKSGPSKEDLDAAQASLDAAQARLDTLKKGASPQDISIVQSKLDQAKANRDLVATTAANTTEQARITMDQAASANQNWLDPESQYEQARLNYEAAQKNEQSQVAIADAQVVAAQAALDQLKAAPSAQDLTQAEDNVTLARANLDKIKKGPAPDDIKAAQAKVDAAQANLNSVKGGASSTDLAILEKQVALAQLSVDDVSAQLADARLTSPIDGTVLNIGLDVGETVGGYQQVATVADTGSLRVNASVDEIDVGRVTAGQAVTVTLDAYPGVQMTGKIDEIAPGATQNQGSTDYQANVSFTPGPGVVPREGMAANVDITAQRKDNVLLLPNRAFETVGNRQYVTLQQNGTTSKVEVQTGLSNNNSTEVLSGLAEGQVVILH